ncbi:MAG TPA: HAD-IIA family hydrolase [Rhizobiales bacterium]|nr:HAD-IIA family hydrolase [Hyphomicrobiales bacterium]
MSPTPQTRGIDAAWSFARYEQIRHRLPRAQFPRISRKADNLAALMEDFDVFLLDAFGVLNVGESAIPGAPERIRQLREKGKTLFVLTNAATLSSRKGPEKYRKFGFQFSLNEIISSRDLLISALADYPAGMIWGVAAPPVSNIEELAPGTALLSKESRVFDEADGFIFLSSQDWSFDLQDRMAQALKTRARPLLVGNPDLVAPRENGLSREPGHFAHEIADKTGISPLFYGKPFANAFEEARKRLYAQGITCPPERIAMVGDTLHTDILGGAAAGIKTILVTAHGLYKGQDITPYLDTSKIIPDYIIPEI